MNEEEIDSELMQIQEEIECLLRKFSEKQQIKGKLIH